MDDQNLTQEFKRKARLRERDQLKFLEAGREAKFVFHYLTDDGKEYKGDQIYMICVTPKEEIEGEKQRYDVRWELYDDFNKTTRDLSIADVKRLLRVEIGEFLEEGQGSLTRLPAHLTNLEGGAVEDLVAVTSAFTALISSNIEYEKACGTVLGELKMQGLLDTIRWNDDELKKQASAATINQYKRKPADHEEPVFAG